MSEGRDRKILSSIIAAVRSVNGIALLDRHVDSDHHRSVLTFAGDPESVGRAAFELVQTGVSTINLRTHDGGHPRVGAVDVIPFIPVRGVTITDCVALAKHLGAQVGSELEIPVFLYEAACSVPARRRLEVIRRGGLQGLASRMKTESLWRPDFGPPTLHPTAGAVVVGARQFLIAFNIVLQSDDLALAKAVARNIRTSGGGLPSLKAIGVELKTRGLVQVSMNLINYQETSIPAAFAAVAREVEHHGIMIAESELVGLVPQDAIDQTMVPDLKLRTWTPDQVLETQLTKAGLW